MDQPLNDLQKAKIDLLKTAFGDVVSTIRAFEYKIRFLLTICLGGLSIFGALYIQFVFDAESLNGASMEQEILYHFLIILLISAGWFAAVRNLFLASEPKNNPQDVLDSQSASFGEAFYIPVSIESSGTLVEQVDIDLRMKRLEQIDGFDALARTYYAEIAILSYIRDLKNLYLSKAYSYVWFSMVMTVLNIWSVFAWPHYKLEIIVVDAVALLGFALYSYRRKPHA